MIEKGILTIKEQEYTFLKPRAYRLIAIEDAAYETGEFDVDIYNQSILNIVDRKLKVKDFIAENDSPVVLKDGTELKVEGMTYNKFLKRMKAIEKPSRVDYALAYLKATGIKNPVLDEFCYDDINTLAEGFLSLYDLSELNETINEIVEYCFPR